VTSNIDVPLALPVARSVDYIRAIETGNPIEWEPLPAGPALNRQL